LKTLGSIVLLFVLFFSSFKLLADFSVRIIGYCQYDVFTLDIETSFNGSSTFELCTNDQGRFVRTTTSTIKYSSNDQRSEISKIAEITNLSVSEFEKLVSLYKNALKFNISDNTTGLDGSNWCLTSRNGMNSVKACFWTPSAEPEERGLLGLHELGKHLWQISKLNERNDVSFY